MTIQEKDEALQKAIREGGYYSPNGVWNSIIKSPTDNKIYRKRVETLIIRNGKEVFCKKKPSGEYSLPGGSTERDIPDNIQAVNECREEARIKVANIQSTGITYKELRKPASWMKDLPIIWDGYITDVYIGEYDGMDHGKVDPVDRDPFVESGRFYTIKDCFKFFRKEHKEAISLYIKNKNEEKEDVINESYLTTYFKNKKFLKDIVKSPDINVSAIDSIIDALDKKYLELKSTSKVKRSIKNGDAEDIFYPVINFEFPDKKEITVCISFANETTDGAAIGTEEYGDLVMVFPIFFRQSKDGKRFTILHEIGHIRLGHIEERNVHRRFLFGDDDTNEYRVKLAQKGKSMYTEINADLYAILSGAKMYSILGSAFKKDYDKENDFRVTNADLANRYSNVYSKYFKYMRGMNVYEFSYYDMMCFGIHDFVYENGSNIEERDKKSLFNFIYESIVREPIRLYSEKYPSDADKDYDKKMFDRMCLEFNDAQVSENTNSVVDMINTKDSIKNFIYEYMVSVCEDLEDGFFTENTLPNSMYYYYNVLSNVLESAQGGIEKKDILYNKEAFDSGKINLCFVTGYSGSGKSSLSSSGQNIEHIDMDKAVMYANRDDSFFKNCDECTRNYMMGPGQKFREMAKKAGDNNPNIGKLWREITKDFVKYVMNYTSSHRDKKFFCDGVWIYKYMTPSTFDKYAVFIKGTSAYTSAAIRGSKRGSNNPNAKKDLLSKASYTVKRFAAVYGDAMSGGLKKFIDYYRPKYEAQIAAKKASAPSEPVKESFVLETKRSELPDRDFGLIIDGKRKYPLDTKEHVMSAIRLFGHCPKSHEKELAAHILSRMRKYKISTDVIGDKNRLKHYI